MPGQLVDRDGEELYWRRYGTWMKMPRKWATEEATADAVKRINEQIDLSLQAQGHREDLQAGRAVKMSDSSLDDFSQGTVTVLGETAILLTKQQEWTLRVEETERRIREYEAELAEDDYEDCEDREWVVEEVLRLKELLPILRQELEALKA